MTLVFALALALGMTTTVFASGDEKPADGGETTGGTTTTETVTIKVTRDTDTYNGEAGDDSRNFTWYRVFTASYGKDFTGNNGGGGYDNDGTPGTLTQDTDHPVSYTATPEVAAKLGTVDATTKAWTTKEGNLWFDLTYIPGTGNYSVTWRKDVAKDADTAQAAAKWLVANGAYEATGTLAFSGSGSTAAWSADGLTKGYYVLSSEAGDNLIAATTNVEVKEKNDYPPQDKQQKDDEDGEEFGDTAVNVAVGDKIDYTVKVTIPKTAKVGDQILVWDKATEGLTYNNDVQVSSNTGSATVADYSGDQGVEGASWQKLITVTANSQGKDVVFSFSMTVNSSALVDVDKKNESGLKYGRGTGNTPFPYESKPDEVEYKTYFGGIEKVDGDNDSTKLANVEFTLKEDGVELKVSKPEGKDYYIVDPNGSSTVITAEDGTIKIRGLDSDKTYTLTETKNPNEGYNMLAEPVTLTLTEDTAGKTTYTPATEYNASAEYYIKDGDNYVKATVTEEEFENGTYYTAETTGTSSYDGTTADTWQDVQNFKGTILPSTGGIGTTMFYIIGTLLVLGAGVVLVTRRKMNAE